MSGEDRSKDTKFSVVAAIVRDGKIFVAKRASHKSSKPDEYEFVGGHVQFGEKLEDAVVREVKEEVGVDISVIDIVDAYILERKDGPKLEVCYLCEIVDESEPVINADDHSESRWISPEEARSFKIVDDEKNALKKIAHMTERANSGNSRK